MIALVITINIVLWALGFLQGYMLRTKDLEKVPLMYILIVLSWALNFWDISTIPSREWAMPDAQSWGYIGLAVIIFMSSSLGSGYIFGEYLIKKESESH